MGSSGHSLQRFDIVGDFLVVFLILGAVDDVAALFSEEILAVFAATISSRPNFLSSSIICGTNVLCPAASEETPTT